MLKNERKLSIAHAIENTVLDAVLSALESLIMIGGFAFLLATLVYCLADTILH